MHRVGIIVAILALVPTAIAVGVQQQDYGFTGEWAQGTLSEVEPAPAEKRQGRGPIAAQVIAVASLEPEDTNFETFNFFEQIFFEDDEVWVAMIVGNLGSETIEGEIIMRVRGPLRDTIRRDVVLQPASAQLFRAKITFPAREAMYRLIGKFKPERGVRGPKTARGAYLVPEDAICC